MRKRGEPSDERQFAMPLSLLNNPARERRYRRRSVAKKPTKPVELS
jgi:hypothetical protein